MSDLTKVLQKYGLNEPLSAPSSSCQPRNSQKSNKVGLGLSALSQQGTVPPLTACLRDTAVGSLAASSTPEMGQADRGATFPRHHSSACVLSCTNTVGQVGDPRCGFRFLPEDHTLLPMSCCGLHFRESVPRNLQRKVWKIQPPVWTIGVEGRFRP